MAVLLTLARTWAPHILRNLPAILTVAQGAYAIFRQIRDDHKNSKETECVKISMALLNRHRDDIDRLLEDPEHKRQLLDGLAILMNRIAAHDATAERDFGFKRPGGYSSLPQANGASDYTAYSMHYDDYDQSYPTKASNSSSSSSSSYKGGAPGSGMCCEVCSAVYDVTTRRPLLMPCGHTFCRPCLDKVARNRSLCCPTCRKPSLTPVCSLSTNFSLLDVLEFRAKKGDNGYDGEDDCGLSKGGDKHGKGGGDGITSLPFEEQIEYAIWLSQREMERHRDDGVLSDCWREIEEMDADLALAMQESEIFYASLLSSGNIEADDSPLYYVEKEPNDKGCVTEERTQGCDASVPDGGDCLATSSPDDESSLRLALELHEEEMRNAQWRPGSSGHPSSWDDYKNLCIQGHQKIKKGKNFVMEENFGRSEISEDSERRMEENGTRKRKEDIEESACCGWTNDDGRDDDDEGPDDDDDDRRLEKNRTRKEKELETVEERNEVERKEQMLLDWAIKLSLEQEDDDEARDGV